MKYIPALPLLVLSSSLLAGCATVVTRPANLAEPPKGIRVYPPTVYLMVDSTEKKSAIAYLPDYRRAYDVQPITILARQDFKVELDEGQLKAMTANADTTALLTLLKEGAALTAKAAGVGVSSTVINGTFGLETGIYRLDDDGVFRRLK